MNRAHEGPCIGTGHDLYRCRFAGFARWPYSRCPSCRQIMQRDHIGMVMWGARAYPLIGTALQ